jgi:hypothetical protein
MPGSGCCAHSPCRVTLLLSCGRHLSDPAQAPGCSEAAKSARAPFQRRGEDINRNKAEFFESNYFQPND